MPRMLDLDFSGATLGTADEPTRPHTYKIKTWGASRCQQAILDLPALVGTRLAATIVSGATGAMTSPAARRLIDLMQQKPETDDEKVKQQIAFRADVLELIQAGLERLTTGLEIEGFIESIMGADVLTLFMRLASGSLYRIEPTADGRSVEVMVVPDDKATFDAQEKTDGGVENFYSGERFAELAPLVFEMLRRNLGPLGRRSFWSAVLKLGTLVPVSTKASSPDGSPSLV